MPTALWERWQQLRLWEHIKMDGSRSQALEKELRQSILEQFQQAGKLEIDSCLMELEELARTNKQPSPELLDRLYLSLLSNTTTLRPYLIRALSPQPSPT